MASHSLRGACLRSLDRARAYSSKNAWIRYFSGITSNTSIGNVSDSKHTRLFGSSSSEKSSLDLATQRKAVEEILTIPDFFSDHWFQAEDLMPFWISQDSEESVEIVFALIDRLEKEQRKLPSLNRPWWINSQLLELAIQKWIDFRQRADPPLKLNSPRDVLYKIESYSEVFPNVNLTETMANLIGNEFAESPTTPLFVDATFGELLIEKTMKNEETELTCDLFANAIHIWYNAAKEKDHLSPPELYHAGQRILFLLELMKELNIKPDSRVYSPCIKIWKWVLQNPCTDVEKQQVTREMKDSVWNNPGNFFDTDHRSFPWSRAFTSVFQSMDSSRVSPEQLSEVASSYIELLQLGHVNCSSQTQIQTLNAALEVLAYIGTLDAVDEAEKIYLSMRSMGLEDDSTLTWRVSVLSGIGQIDAAEDLLEKFEESESRSAPIDAHFVLLENMAKRNNPLLMHRAEKVRKMLSSDPSLNTAMFNSFLSSVKSFTKEQDSRLSPDIERMKWSQKAFLSMDVYEHLNASAEKGQLHLEPNGDSYYHTMNCWAMCGNERLALYWFGAMIKAFRLGNTNAMPKLRDFNEALRVLAQSDSKESSGKAEQIFNTISVIGTDEDQLRPDIESYRLLLTCLSKNGGKEAAFRAENILQRAFSHGFDLMDDRVSASLINACLDQAGHSERGKKLTSKDG